MDIYTEAIESVNISMEELLGMDIAEESINLSNVIKNISFDKIVDSFFSLIDTIIANVRILSNNLLGYRMSKVSADVINSMIDVFDEIVRDCTYNTEKVFRGLSADDLRNKVNMFTPQLVSSKGNHQKYLNVANGLLTKLSQASENVNPNMIEYADYDETKKIQKRIIMTERKIKELSRKAKVTLTGLMKAKEIGMHTGYIEGLLNYNRSIVAQIGQVLIVAFGKVWIKPASERDINPNNADTYERIIKDARTIIKDKNILTYTM